MNPFLNLAASLSLAGMEVRAIREGRAAIVGELERLQGQDEFSAEDQTRWDGLTQRCSEIDAHLRGLNQSSQRAESLRNLQQNTPGVPNAQRNEPRNTTSSPAPIVRGAENNDQPDLLENPEAHGEFSLFRAVRCILDRRPVDGFEGEVSQEMARRSGRSPQGFFIPWTLRCRSGQEQRAAFTTTQAAGVIPTVHAGTIIDVLRNRMVMAQLGAVVLTDLVGVFEIPKKTGVTSAYWVGEAGEPTESAPTTGQVAFNPSTVGAYTDLTRRAINQSSIDVENMVRFDLIDTLRLELDRVGLNGSGASNQPEGILQNSGVGTIAIGTNGGAMTHQKLIDMETGVAVDNADIGNLAYLTSAHGRGHLKGTPKISGYPSFLWNDANQVNGYQAVATNQMPSGLSKGTASGTLTSMIFGNFADAMYGFWGGIDINVDTASLSKSGGTRLVALADADFQLRRVESFRKCVDILHGYVEV